MDVDIICHTLMLTFANMLTSELMTRTQKLCEILCEFLTCGHITYGVDNGRKHLRPLTSHIFRPLDSP